MRQCYYYDMYNDNRLIHRISEWEKSFAYYLWIMARVGRDGRDGKRREAREREREYTRRRWLPRSSTQGSAPTRLDLQAQCRVRSLARLLDYSLPRLARGRHSASLHGSPREATRCGCFWDGYNIMGIATVTVGWLLLRELAMIPLPVKVNSKN